jgi:hypothetical protein
MKERNSMNIKLMIVSKRWQDEGSMAIDHASCVPHIGSILHTIWGIREVKSVCYDFNEYTGTCKVEVEVDTYLKEKS